MNKTEMVFESIKTNQLDNLQDLLAADPGLAEISDDNNISLLLFAIYHRNQEAISLIKSYKKNISIYEAACLGDLTILKKELEKKVLLLNGFTPDGFTLLGYACFFGQEEIAAYLIHCGADVNTASLNTFGVYPIHSACAISNLYLTQLLIKNGADVNVRQQGGFTPLHSAVINSAPGIESLLLAAGADASAENNEGKTAFSCRKPS